MDIEKISINSDWKQKIKVYKGQVACPRPHAGIEWSSQIQRRASKIVEHHKTYEGLVRLDKKVIFLLPCLSIRKASFIYWSSLKSYLVFEYHHK